ncbi:8-amino-7-oxononanoate synthase [Bienertia sinuspersici]
MSMKWDEWTHNVSNNFHAHEYQVFDNLRQWDRTSVEVMILTLRFIIGSMIFLVVDQSKFLKVKTQMMDNLALADCRLCPTGFAANMAFMVAVGSIASLLASSKIPHKTEKVAVFSDALNHASIIDGLRLGERLKCVETFVYRHCDMSHLDALLSDCKMSKKVVVTDSLFSMDGDFAPLTELATLRKKHGFLLVIDDAHGTFICGKNGGGVAQEFNCESDVDICIGTLTAAAFVAGKEVWRRRAIQERVQDFRNLTGIPITSHIVSIIVGSEEKSLLASRYMLKSGFHVTAI